MGGCRSKPESPRGKTKRGDTIQKPPGGGHNNGDAIQNSPAGDGGGEGGSEVHKSTKGSHRSTTNTGKGSGRKGDLEDEKKAISDNVRGGQFLDYYFVGPEIGRYHTSSSPSSSSHVLSL
jgi:hypothetical protein